MSRCRREVKGGVEHYNLIWVMLTFDYSFTVIRAISAFTVTEATIFHPCAVAINKNNSSKRKSLFSLSLLGAGTSSIAYLSANGEALTAAPSEAWRPGIAEQYTLQLDKLSAGVVSTAIVSMPVYTTCPSASNLLYQSFVPKDAC